MATPIYPGEAPPDSDGQASQDRESITIEEELGQWPEHIDARVAEALLVAQQDRSEQERSRNSRRKRAWIAALASAVVLLSAVALLWWFKGEKPALQSSSQPAPTQPVPVSNLQNTNLNVGKSEQTQSVKETEATLSQQGQEILRIVKLDFFGSKFIVDNTRLKNQGDLIENFQRRRDSLDGGWVLIFAAASLEGHEDYNLRLCSQRLVAVRRLMQNGADIKAKSYWGILAGENKVDLPGVKPEDEEEAEEAFADERGEPWLAEQRRLIVVGIKEIVPLQPQAAEQVPYVVAKHLYDNNLLPKNYDSSGSKPFLITQKASAEDGGGGRSDNK
jgi:hypothetical protein